MSDLYLVPLDDTALSMCILCPSNSFFYFFKMADSAIEMSFIHIYIIYVLCFMVWLEVFISRLGKSYDSTPENFIRAYNKIASCLAPSNFPYSRRIACRMSSIFIMCSLLLDYSTCFHLSNIDTLSIVVKDFGVTCVKINSEFTRILIIVVVIIQ